MNQSSYSLLIKVALCASVAPVVYGQTLFFDDFEAWTVGQPTTDSGNSPERWKSDGDPFDIIEQDTGNVFGLGTDNQFIRFGNVTDGGTLPGGKLDIEQRNYDKGDGVPTGVLRLSFDFYEPSSGSGKGLVANLGEPGELRLRGDDSGSGLHEDIIFDDGILQVDGDTLHNFGEDTVVRFDFIFNQSGADVTYLGNVLNSGKFDVYADGSLVGANLESGENDATDEIERILLRTEYAAGGTDAQEMWIDNWQTAAVPEPSTYALWAGGLMLGLTLWRRRGNAR